MYGFHVVRQEFVCRAFYLLPLPARGLGAAYERLPQQGANKVDKGCSSYERCV
jgi:hypothetical protein